MLETERISPRYKDIDLWEPYDIALAFWEGQMRAVSCVHEALPEIEKASLAIAQTLSSAKSRIIYAGAGSSGLLAMQDGMEMPPTFGWPLDRLVFLMAGGDQARLSPIGSSEDEVEFAEKDALTTKFKSNDILIAVAASGTTPYTLKIAEKAREAGALIISISNNQNSPLFDFASHSIYLKSGAEVIAGSTRLNAGTSQKAALGILSSMTMIHIGEVIDGMMINLTADNDKLVKRASNIIQNITGVTASMASQALELAKGSVKDAILIALGCSAAKASKILEQSHGNMREAMSSIKDMKNGISPQLK